ncbi:MAG: hypothetical protein ACT4N2_00570 [Hyphomicrobium sp.]
MSDATHSLALGNGDTGTETGTDANGRLVGFALVCIVPAVFWTALLSLAGATLGLEVSTSAQVSLAAAIAGFLGVVFAALTVNPRVTESA